MRELWIDKLELTDESGEKRRYDYYIVAEEIGGTISWESYGVKILEEGASQVAVVPDVTCSLGRMEELCRLLIRNRVTPITLRDVVLDWL